MESGSDKSGGAAKDESFASTDASGSAGSASGSAGAASGGRSTESIAVCFRNVFLTKVLIVIWFFAYECRFKN